MFLLVNVLGCRDLTPTNKSHLYPIHTEKIRTNVTKPGQHLSPLQVCAYLEVAPKSGSVDQFLPYVPFSFPCISNPCNTSSHPLHPPLAMSHPCPSYPRSPDSADSSHCYSLPLFLGFLFLAIFLLAFFSIFLVRYLHHLYGNSTRRRNGSRRSAGSPSSAQSRGLDRVTIATFPVYMFRAGISYCRSTPECAICLAEFVDGELCRLVVRCGHEFHLSCIDQWLVQHNTCPLCRRKLDSAAAAVEKSSPWRDWCRRGDLISPGEDPVAAGRDESDVVVEVVQSHLPSNVAGLSEEGGAGGGSGASTCVTVEESGEDRTRQEEGSYNVHGNERV